MPYNPGAIPKADQDAINYSHASTSSTYDANSLAATREAREVDDDRASVYTYESHMDHSKFVKTVDNRNYNALSDIYFLPTDNDEWTRLNKQHVAMVVAMGGLYAAPEAVRSILAPQEGESKRILDLGCGTGVWACEMAKEFPHSEVLGIDLAPVPIDTMDVPPNCSFEIDDINLGLAHFTGKFDVVHARFIASGLGDFRKTMRDAHACLKPGGIVLWIDVDYDVYARDRRVYMPFATDDDERGSWFQRLIYEIRRAAVGSGRSDIFGMTKALDAGLWNEPLLDADTCKSASLYLPIGPWPEGGDGEQLQQIRFIGSLIRQDLMSVHRAGHAVIKRSGFSEETLQEWSRKADEEMMNLSKPMWMRVRHAWGRRRADDGSPAPPLPPPPPSQGRDSPTSRLPPYSHFHIYNTQEQALDETELRNRNKAIPAPPLPAAVQN